MSVGSLLPVLRCGLDGRPLGAIRAICGAKLVVEVLDQLVAFQL